MRVTIDARLYGTAHRGIGRYLRELVRSLLELDQANSYTLLVSDSNQPEFKEIADRVTLVNAPWRVYSIAEQLYVPKLIWYTKPDVVHFPHFNVPLLPLPPYVVTIHDLLVHQFPNERATTRNKLAYAAKLAAYHITVRQTLKRAECILTVSEAVSRTIAAEYPWATPKLKVVPLAPVTMPVPAVGNGTAALSPYVLVVGAAYPHKNLERAIRAVALVRVQVPTCRLVIVGKKDYFMERLLEWADRNGYGAIVSYLGEVSDFELSGLYASASAYFLPSLGEGFGLGGLEALHFGCPVVASDIPVLHEVLGEAAVFADPYQESAMAKALIRVITMSDERDKLAEHARNVLVKYSWRKTAAATSEVYRQMIAQAR
jgi:glycosyltransferase involved in cell wall biosynthesis